MPFYCECNNGLPIILCAAIVNANSNKPVQKGTAGGSGGEREREGAKRKGEAAAVTTMGAQPHVNLPERWQIVKSCKVPTAVSRYTLYTYIRVCMYTHTYVLYEIRAATNID